MRYIIDNMPQMPKDCDLSEWIPNPPYMEEPGKYMCKLDKQVCDMEKDEYIHWSGCRHLKEL